MPELLDVLPVDSLNRLASALASIANAEARISATTAGYLAVLERTATRINAMGAALDELRLPTANQKINAGVSAATPTPGAPNQQADALLGAIARNTAAAARLLAAMGKATVGVSAPKEPATTKQPATGDMSGLGDALANSFGRAKASILDFVGAASPSHFSTLQASITMLSIELGTVFLPYIEYASRAVQATARWFRNLDDTTKTNIGRAAMFGAALGGLVIVARQLHAAYVVLRASILAVNLAMSASPVGAVVKMIGVVAGLAAAWWGVNQAITAVNASPAGQAPGAAAQPVADLTQEEIDAMPEKYKKRYDAIEQLPEAARPAARQQIAKQFRDDIEAQIELLPPDAQARIKAKPTTRNEEIQKEAARLRELATKQREMAPDIAAQLQKAQEEEQTRGPARQKAMERALQDNTVRDAIKQQIKAAEAATGFQGNRAAGVIPGDPKLYKPVQDAFFAALEKLDPEAATFARTNLKPLQLAATTPPELNRFQSFTAKVQPINIAQQLAQAVKLESKAGLLENLVAALGKKPGEDGFVKNIKSPIQSRFTDAFQYAESAQLAVLNQGDADAQNLRRQLEILTKSVGDISNVIADYAQRTSGAAGENFWRGSIDLGR